VGLLGRRKGRKAERAGKETEKRKRCYEIE